MAPPALDLPGDHDRCECVVSNVHPEIDFGTVGHHGDITGIESRVDDPRGEDGRFFAGRDLSQVGTRKLWKRRLGRSWLLQTARDDAGRYQ